MQDLAAKLVWPAGLEWMAEEQFWRELWVFAVFLHNDEHGAGIAVDKALQALWGRPDAEEPTRARRFLFSRIRRSAPAAAAGSIIRGHSPDAKADALSVLRRLPPSSRALAGLYFGSTLPAAEAARVLGLSPAELSRQLEQLARRLVRAAEDAGLALDLSNLHWESTARGLEQDVSTPVGQAVRALAPDAGKLRHLMERACVLAAQGQKTHFSPFNPAFLAFVFAAVLSIGLGIWAFLGQSDSFPGEEMVVRLLETGTNASAEDYEPVAVPLQDMGDWFALQGLEGFWTPSGFGDQQTLAARVFSFEGKKVAAVLLPEQQMIVYFFDGASLGVEVQPPGHWRFLQSGGDAGAVVQKGRLCFLATKRGSREELRDSLELILPRG